MDIITIESSDDGDSCNDEDEVECSCVGANAKSPHANDDIDIGDDGNDNDDDNDSGSTSSSDDSIWNKTGLSLSLKRKSADLLANHPADNGDGDVEVEKLGNPPPTAALQCSSNEQSNDNASKKTTETENAASRNKYITQDSVDIDDHDEEPLPPEVPINKDGAWRIVLLMDHREFGCRKGNFLPTVETNINNHFGGKYSEITTLPSADFLFVARLLSKVTGQIMDERVLDLVIERKNVEDLSQCLLQDSKKYKPLSFFEAQMYKLRHCGVRKKLFLMEDDEDRAKCFFVGVKTPIERDKSLKRVKTIR